MYIKNKLFRFLVSIFLALLIYFLLVMLIETKYAVVDVLFGMLIFALVGVFIVVPTLIFMTYLFYTLFTKREIRPKTAGKIIKISMILLLIIVLFHVAAFKPDLLDNLF